MTTIIKTKKKVQYVNNLDFLKALIKYKKDVRASKRAKSEIKPKIPDYIGKCLLLIAENLSHKPNFVKYTFRDEMVGDAIENCIMYFDNFDPKRSKNPFAYFTQIIWYAFIRRIHKEKKQLYTKYKITEQTGILDDRQQLENDSGETRQFELYDNISEFIGNYEKTNFTKKVKVKEVKVIKKTKKITANKKKKKAKK